MKTRAEQERGEQTLLPCPFCGATGPVGLEICEDEGWFRVACNGCGVEQGMVKGSAEEAIAAWNSRYPGDGLRGGRFTINEARQALGMPPVDDADPDHVYTLVPFDRLPAAGGIADEVRYRRLVSAQPLTLPCLPSTAFQVPGEGKILAIYEGTPGEPGIHHAHIGLSESEVPIDEVPDLGAFNSWEPVPGRCALLQASRIFRLGAEPTYPMSVLISGEAC